MLCFRNILEAIPCPTIQPLILKQCNHISPVGELHPPKSPNSPAIQHGKEAIDWAPCSFSLIKVFLTFTCQSTLLQSSREHWMSEKQIIRWPLPWISFYLCRKFGRQLSISVANPLHISLGGKQKQLHFQEDRVARPILRKNTANYMILYWPTAGF